MVLKKPAIALLLAIYSTILLAAVPAGAGQGCAEQVMKSCSKCHLPARICEKLGKKGKREWQSSMKRMLRYGLILTGPEQEEILKCLLTLAGDRGNLCK